MQKQCSICQISKDVSLFFKKSNGYQSRCKICSKNYAKEYNKKNAAKIAEVGALYRLKHHDEITAWQKQNYLNNKDLILNKNKEYLTKNYKKIRTKQKEYVTKNKELLAQKNKEYQQQNPEVKRRSESKRRAFKNKLTGSLSKNIVSKLKVLQNNLCIVCKKKLIKYHIDHIIPLAKGGDNNDYNIQLLCPSCNCQKHAKHPIEFMQEKGYLL